MVIGSHGSTHRILTQLNDAELYAELKNSKDALEQHLGISVDDLSIPRGFYDQRVLQVAGAVGYKNIFTSEESPQQVNCYGRIAVKSNWTEERLLQALVGKVPASEKIFDLAKRVAKRCLGTSGYNYVRQAFLKE